MYYQAKNNFLNKKTLLITGAGDGIGREAALTYSRFGASLILVGKTKLKLENVSKEIKALTGKDAKVYELNLLTASLKQYQTLSHKISENYLHLDGVLHNAGLLGVIAPIIEQPANLWHDVIQVNLNAAFMLTQVLIPLLLKAPNASLIFTSSSVGKKGRSGWGAYSASKFAIEGLMQILAEEYKNSNLRVNCINPGSTRTNMRLSAFPEENQMQLKTPAEIMPTYLYVMSHDSVHQTGISFDAQPNCKKAYPE
ncbi:YciK family oxidoreductase [Candidatus Hartigia pinicola]